MAVTTKWDMLVPQDANVVHNLIRNPSFEYNDQFFAGITQYWSYYSSAGIRSTTAVPQTSNWATRGTRALALSLGTTSTAQRYATYMPQESAFDKWGTTPASLQLGNIAGSQSGVVYTSGNWAACVFLLTPYGSSLATLNDDDPVPSGNNLIPRSWFRQIDLTKGRSQPFFTAVSNFGGTVFVRSVRFTMPSASVTPGTGTHPYPANSLGYAVFVSTPTLSASGRRIWRLLTVKTGVADGITVTVDIPSDDTGAGGGNYYGYGSTTFLTSNAPASVGNYYVYDSSGAEQLATFIGNDASQPSLGISPTSVVGTTYKHHFYLDWYVDTNYTAATSPFIACACDYKVSIYDRNTSSFLTVTNYDTGTDRLAATPTDRASDKREGRSKFLITPPNNSVNTNAGRDLEIRIEIVSPTGVYTNNAAILYVDCLQLVDIAYRGDDDFNWDDVEFSYLDGDVSGAEWHDYAPSYRTSSGTTVNGIDVSWYWLGDTYMGWNATFGMANRDRYIQENTAVYNTYGGTSRLGYAQSFLRSPNSDTGTYVPIDKENFGASVLYSSTGMGMPEIVTSSQSYGAVDGGIVQRQVASMRTMQLSIEINGSSSMDLHDKRRRIINALKFDQLSQQSTRTMRYRGSGTNVLFSVTYTAGLEFTGYQGVSFTENASIQFLCAEPYVYAENAVLKRFVNPPLVQDTRFLMAYKKGDNQPWMYTGMKDYQAWTYGYGTISAVTPPTANPGVTITMSITNSAYTLTTTLGSVTATLSTAFFQIGTVDAGRTLVGINGLVLGVIASVTNTTSPQTIVLTTGASSAYSSTTWYASSNRLTQSAATLTTANDAGKYIYTTAANTLVGRIQSVSGTTVYLESYLFITANIAAASITIVGTNTYGSSQLFTGVNTGFTSNDVGKLVYKTANTYVPPVLLGAITSVSSTTSLYISLVTARAGTITILYGGTSVTGSGTDFSANDVGSLILTSTGFPIGVITSFSTSTSVGIGSPNQSAITVLPTSFVVVRIGTVASTAYTIQTPELEWTGGYKKYHIGMIESPDTGTTAVIVGGFNNGSPAMGYGFSKYHAVFLLDGKQNTSAGNYTNSEPRSGTITTSATFPYTVTGSGTSFTPSDVGAAIYNTSDVFIGVISRWNSATSVNLIMTPTTAMAGVGFYTRSTATQPNPDYSSVVNIMNRNATSSEVSGYYTIVPTAPITAIYQESPFSIIVAGTFQGYGFSGAGLTDIRLIRIKGWMRRRATTSTRGAADVFGSGDEDIEVIMWDSLAGWGTPVINCITTDLNGNLYVGGTDFTTSNVWYVGRPNDGTYGTVTQPLGQLTQEVYALITDSRFPVANVFAAIDALPYLRIYPYYNELNSTGIWKTPPTITNALGTSQQRPDDVIYGFLRTQAGDILVYGAFTQWGGTYGAVCNGIARLVPKITTFTQNQTYVDATPAVPAAGSYTQPGVASGDAVLAMADFSYPPTTGSYAGTGERLLFGGNFAQFGDGRYSLGLGYLEGSGNASSVRRMAVSDLGLSQPPSSTDYPYINAITTTNRNRYYYANQQVNSTDNLVGPSAAILITKSANTSDYANNSRYFQSGAGGYATTANYGIPQTLVIPVEVRGTANAFPVITATLFWRTTIYEITNVETGARLRFDELYGLRGVSAFSGTTETITMDFRPGYRSVVSNIRGNLMQYVSPDSDLSDFYLIAPTTTNSTMDTTHTNTLTIRYTVYHDTIGSNTPTVPRVTLWYTPRFWSFDVPQLYKDAPDTPMI